MSDDAWYRSPDWEEPDRQLFEAKLVRARSRRSQYLRIKGLALCESERSDVREAGRGLLERLFAEHPAAGIDIGIGRRAAGDSFVRDGQPELAAKHYAAAFDIKGLETGAELALAELIVAMGDKERLSEALGLIARVDHLARDPAPAARFSWNRAAARVAAASGELGYAAEHAAIALRCLEQTKSPFPRHPGVGLARATLDVEEELRTLARGG